MAIEKEEENKKQWKYSSPYTKDKFRYEYVISYLNRVYDDVKIQKTIDLYVKKLNEEYSEEHWKFDKATMQFAEKDNMNNSNDVKDQYLKIRDLTFDVESANISIKQRANDYILFIELKTISRKVEGEMWHPYLYINNGIPLNEDDINNLARKTFEYDYELDNSQTWIMYVLGHENIKKGRIEILSQKDNVLSVKWSGEADIYFNEDYDENVPFESSFEAKLEIVEKNDKNTKEQEKEKLAKDFLNIVLENYFTRKNIASEDEKKLYRTFLPKINILCSKEELLDGNKNLVISFPIYKFEKENSYRIFSWINYYLDKRLIDKSISLDENGISEDTNFFDFQNNKELFTHFGNIFKIFIGLVTNEFNDAQYEDKLKEMYSLICNYEKEILQIGKGEFTSKAEKNRKFNEIRRENQEEHNENVANQKMIDENGFREFILKKMGDLNLTKESTEEEERIGISDKCSDMINLIKKYQLKFIDVEYQLSKRQKAVMQAAENMIIDKLTENKNYNKYSDIYWEIWDFVHDYGDKHDGNITGEEYDVLLKLLNNLKKCCDKK